MTRTGTQSDHPSPEADGLSAIGLAATGRVFWNLATAALCERAVARGEARLADTGALVVTTAAPAEHARCYLVRDAAGEDAPEGADGDVPDGSRPAAGDPSRLSRAHFEALKSALLDHAASRTLFAQELHVVAGPGLRLRVLSEQAWHALLARHLMPPAAAEEGSDGATATRHAPDFTVVCAPGFRADPTTHGVEASGAVAIDLDNGVALVAGTAGSEAIRHALFSFLAHRLPDEDVLPLLGAATTGPTGEVALFLGPTGAGKSALAGDATHARIGDGALGWHADGLVALETGLSARPGDLSAHPETEAAARRFGAVLENVAVDAASRAPDFAHAGAAAHARAIVSLGSDPAAGTRDVPAHLFMLVHDGFGVLPPIARLTPAQALYHYLSGYGAAAPDGAAEGIAEAAVPARFAPCLASGLPHAPEMYGKLLRARLARHEPSCWLVNTGWIGGRAGAGRRVPLETSRRLVDAAQAGELASGEWRTDPHFGFAVPAALEGIDPALLDPAKAWASRVDHAMVARRLAALFTANFARFEKEFGEDVRGAQPGMAMAAE